MSTFPDIENIESQLDDVDHDVKQLVLGLGEERGRWRARSDTWSVAECLDHLATANRVYLSAMQVSAIRAAAQGRQRRGPAVPGRAGRWIVKSFEPPVRFARSKAPMKIRPRPSPTLAEALADFLAAQEEVRAFLCKYGNLDLSGTRFDNPLVKGLRFSLATGLHIIAAHERRHVWQAWRVRQASESQPASSE